MKASIVASVEPGYVPLGIGGDFGENAKIIAGLGFEGVELHVDELETIDTCYISDIAGRHGLKITGVGSGQHYVKHRLGLSTNDEDVRKRTIDRVARALQFASELKSNIHIGAGQGTYTKTYEEGLSHLTESLRECAKVAQELSTRIDIEICNRYLPAMIRTIDQGKILIDAVGSPWVRLLADTHHMNIEEASLPESIRGAKGYLAYMHFSDSNRLAPGMGHIDYRAIAEALKDIEYEGFCTAEFIPQPDPITAARQMIRLMKSLPY
jgi:sugar phosphate isomerase/epimerase